MIKYNILHTISSPYDLKKCTFSELSTLSHEIRQFLIYNVTKTGGHLAPNLGVVELTMALHYVFDSPKDGLIWDVGHQAYVHKILTGRQELFPTLRKKNGLSGYPSPQESEHDIVHAGHSSTSISLGVGIASAKKLNNDNSFTIAIIGDGSFTSGMIYEALNDASWRKLPLLIVLNDNKMSISENVGGIAKHLNFLRTNTKYLSLKKEISKGLSQSSMGRQVFRVLFSLKSLIRNLLSLKSNIFENLGVKYLGPFNGHNLPQLISCFNEIKKEMSESPEPMIIHICTEKGKGHEDSYTNPTQFHGISGKDDSIPLTTPKGQTWSTIFGDTICELAKSNKDIVAITAAMREGTGLCKFAKEFPDRFIDVGIAEQHAVTCAAGLAIQGKKPIVAIYSTFLQRAYDQIIHDVSLASYPVIFCLDRSGLVPGDGQTHQGVFDIAFLRTIPNMIIMSPLTAVELSLMMEKALSWDKPVAIRYPKDIAPTNEISSSLIVLGQGVELHEGRDGVIVIFGSLLNIAQDTQQQLESLGKKFSIYHCRFAQPISKQTIEYLNQFPQIIILEEGIETGSIGEYLKLQLPKKEIITINTGNQIPSVGTRESLLDDFGFDVSKIVQRIK